MLSKGSRFINFTLDGGSMEQTEKDLVQRAIPFSPKLRKLYNEHRSLDTNIARASRRRFLTSREEVELRNLKRRKLSHLEAMIRIAREVEATNGSEARVQREVTNTSPANQNDLDNGMIQDSHSEIPEVAIAAQS